MKNTLFIIVFLFSLNLVGQKLECSSLKNGIFIAESSEPIRVKWKINRTDNYQVEEILEIPQELIDMGYPLDLQYEIIEWIDECSYRLLYDESKMMLTDSQRILNDNGGVIATITSIDGDCHYYSSKTKINGQEQIIEGKLCME